MRAAGRPVLMALAVVATVLAASAPPAAGRGTSEIVGVTDIGKGARETWVLLPSEDPPTCVVVFLHGGGDPTPSRYLGWLDHLALGESCAVVFPRYRLTGNSAPANLGDLRAGVSAGIVHVRRARYGFERRRGPTTLRTVVAGVGLGGSLAFYYAANAKGWGLPVPAAACYGFHPSQLGTTLAALVITARVTNTPAGRVPLPYPAKMAKLLGAAAADAIRSP